MAAVKINKVSHQFNNKDVILHGHRNFQDELWDMPITYDVAKYNITGYNFLVPPLHNFCPKKDFPIKTTKLQPQQSDTENSRFFPF